MGIVRKREKKMDGEGKEKEKEGRENKEERR